MGEIIGGEPRKRRFRVLFPIGAKLVVVFALILFIALVAINDLVSRMASRDLLDAADEANYAINSRSAAEAEDKLNTVRGSALVFLDLVRLMGRNSPAARQAEELFFERMNYIAAVIVPGSAEYVNRQYFAAREANPGFISTWLSAQAPAIQRASGGEPLVANASAEFKTPLLAMFYPWQQSGLAEAVVILFSPDRLAEIFGIGDNSCFMANMEGDALVHADYRMAMNNSNVSNHPLLAALANADSGEIRQIYTENGVRFFGAGKKLSIGGLAVFTSIEYELPFQRTSAAIRRNSYIIVSAIFLSALFVWLLSKTISRPLRRLNEAMSNAAAGNFAASPEYRFPDEIGLLCDSFAKLGAALEKRERFMDAYGAASGGLAEGGRTGGAAEPAPDEKPPLQKNGQAERKKRQSAGKREPNGSGETE